MAKPAKTINLALQGGGAHGAYAWGVLDYLLEDGRLKVEAICATSAGTMNACAFAYGLHTGGASGARAKLHEFWRGIHRAGTVYNPVKRLPWEGWLGGSSWNMDNAIAFQWFESVTRVFSPYQFNPFDFNPLNNVLEECIDFKELRRCQATRLYISATHVATGKVRVFGNDKLSLNVALASACLPLLYKAVTIDGEDYWDGGYMGNPVLYPLFYAGESRDVMIVHINPIERDETPRDAADIMNRINEISFNSSLLAEIRAIAFVKRLLEQDMLRDEFRPRFKNMLVHSIRADEAMKDLSVASKFNSDWAFLTYLRDLGRESVKQWLARHYQDLGERDTVNLQDMYLYSVRQTVE